MSLIEASDSPMSAIVKVSKGNPGAVRVCTELISRDAEIDKLSAFGPFGSILSLDTHQVYGPRIWQLYKDVCGQDIVGVVTVLRAVQLGFLSDAEFNHAIDNYGDGIDVLDLNRQVRERLGEGNFAALETAAQ